MRFTYVLLTGLVAACFGTGAQAVTVPISVTGTVAFNQVGGTMTSVGAGAPVNLSFNVDSGNFLNSAFYPTRGYVIDPASFVLNIGGVALSLSSSETSPFYFVLRNNDPGVDGVFISHGVDTPVPLMVNIPGVSQAHEFHFTRTFNGNTTTAPDPTFQSLNIFDAFGSYGPQTYSTFGFRLQLGPAIPTEMDPATLTIGAVPEPATVALSLLGLGVVGGVAARRRSSSSGSSKAVAA